jgi:pimeloyl-ACP methyl ester carboxylesterase
MTDLVALVPGAGVGGADLWLLAWRLRRMGYHVEIFFCLTWAKPLAQSAGQLYRWLLARPEPRIHLVGHSLGGLVILRCLAEYGWAKAGRVVTIGTPHTDITIARQLMRAPMGRWVAGRGVMSALPLLPLRIPAGREVGVIAGNQDWGSGALLAVPRPNDMAVSVEETRHPEITQRIVLRVSHVGMLFSRQIADEIDVFLRNGQFTSSGFQAGESDALIASLPSEPERRHWPAGLTAVSRLIYESVISDFRSF